MNVLKTVDAVLNKITMYRLMVYVLAGLQIVAVPFALLGVIGVSAVGLIASTAILLLVCWSVNLGISRILQVPHNTESWLITALILACVMPPVTDARDAISVVVVGLIAIASKYILVYRGSHVFNPVAIAAVVLSLVGLTPATWWIATPNLLPITAIIGAIVLRKTRRGSMFLVFMVSALVVMLLVGSVAHGLPVATVLRNAFLSWPLVFFGTIMLTEPITLPVGRYYQLLFAAIVGSIFASQLHVGIVSATPQVALVIGNLFALLATPTFGAMLRLKQITQLSPNQYDLVFEPPKRGLRYRPGQYMEWTLPHAKPDARGNRRSFSVASSPSESEVHIGIKHYEPSSTFKTALLRLQPGQRIRAAHVQGDFTLPGDTSKPLVFIAGGIGITPFRSMAKYMSDAAQSRDVTLFYIAASEADFVYRDVFEEAERIGMRTHYITGMLDKDVLQAAAPQLRNAQVYLSGPDAMVQNYKTVLRSLSVARDHIKTDRFTGY